MRTKLQLLFAVAALVLATACEKDLPQYLAFEDYEFAGTDADGGDWKPILLTSGSDIDIPAPSEAGSAEYAAEVAAVKNNLERITEEELKAVNYWTANPALRWNEIALELIAKYNLIPGPNADGTYTLPSPANPAGPPSFPFAHPPYAARALAYLSVAQFDGMVSAWHHKYAFNRPSPATQDPTIAPLYLNNQIPAYPSDGAVIAKVSRRILTAMFPLEAEYLRAREEDHLRCLVLSGLNVPSDIAAGLTIGDAVSDLALERAANDRMKFAQAPKAVADSLAAAAFNRFGWQWTNREVPQRPVGLTPLYGKVRMWAVDDVTSTRPGPPPAIGSPEFEEDVELLKEYAKKVTPEQRRIANFWQDGIGTYTPPGHWNQFAKDFVVKYKLNPLRTARTFAYLNMAMMDGGISCWDAKYYYHYPRPINLIEDFKTIAGTPNFPSYTSGHSVFSAAGAEVLAYVFPEEATLVRGWAEEAALSRVFGGIHWTFDATVGTAQGRDVARHTIAIAQADGAD